MTHFAVLKCNEHHYGLEGTLPVSIGFTTFLIFHFHYYTFWLLPIYYFYHLLFSIVFILPRSWILEATLLSLHFPHRRYLVFQNMLMLLENGIFRHWPSFSCYAHLWYYYSIQSKGHGGPERMHTLGFNWAFNLNISNIRSLSYITRLVTISWICKRVKYYDIFYPVSIHKYSVLMQFNQDWLKSLSNM